MSRDPQQHEPDLSGVPPRQPFSKRLAVYLAGVAIGLMLLGWFQMKKHQAVQREQAAQQAAQQQAQQAGHETARPAGGQAPKPAGGASGTAAINEPAP